MVKNISVRGRKDLVAIYNKYAQISGEQHSGRPQATLEFIKHVADLPLNENTVIALKAASKQRIDTSGVADNDVPTSIKIPVDVDDATWNKAMNIFRFVFNLEGNPQMPYFLRVGMTYYIRKLEEQNVELGVGVSEVKRLVDSEIERFKKLNTDDKLVELYKILREREGMYKK